MTDYDELARKAREATPGPWRQSGTKAHPHWYVTSDTAQVHGNFPKTQEDYAPETIRRWNADAAYIAAASPDVILALLEERKVLREAPPDRISVSEAELATTLRARGWSSSGQWLHLHRDDLDVFAHAIFAALVAAQEKGETGS